MYEFEYVDVDGWLEAYQVVDILHPLGEVHHVYGKDQIVKILLSGLL